MSVNQHFVRLLSKYFIWRAASAFGLALVVVFFAGLLTVYFKVIKYTYTPLSMEVLNMRQCMDADNLHRRLKKIIGQVQAIDRMVDEDVPCEDVLSQINAAKSALHKVGQVVLEGHINHCVRDGIEHGDADKTIESFTKAVERFANMT